ncbi:ABC transporter substrate-binding protein [Myceligenerans pegani]|uniref:ABC transporter substrate-binding protein n=1 Tax=Myceligenerans pegani TaxID=2776917 RepID=A0ABR9N5I8_9MICO|nr:ABC transporter substrate-binding protein [Myceligenerans sp. TRM 65318]MBE1878257.1 ABC transporter substrate-binding protein [Myceligenerans sp. TRM 65318]MBE3020528.1 ABC transporter substrate-binding protein [Myceligenerans sp. TRM 65318]
MSAGRRAGLTAVGAALLAATLVGCGASEPVPEQAAAAAAVGEGGTTYPLTLANCGQEVTFEAPPQRVVSLDQGSTEILLSLGLEDRMVGTASWTDPVREDLAEANAGVPRLADEAPTYEVVLDTEPDLVTASFGRHFVEGGVAERSRFTGTGIESYLSPTDCDGDTSINGAWTARTSPLTIDALYQEIRELAQIFDVPGRGEALIEQLERRREAALKAIDASGLTVAFWFADLKTPYFAGGGGSPNLLATDAGAENVFADLDDDWVATTWETVVERDPDVLVMGDLSRRRWPGDQASEKIDFLESDPLTRNLSAVAEDRYILLHGAELNPSIRMIDGLEELTEGLRSFESAQ